MTFVPGTNPFQRDRITDGGARAGTSIDVPRHGTASGYERGCRCDRCTAKYREVRDARGSRRLKTVRRSLCIDCGITPAVLAGRCRSCRSDARTES